MHATPAPDLQELLPPILACLPTAFVSPQPPPALIPLLSPILRQRICLLTTTQAQDRSSTGWLRLLTWSPGRASRLEEIVSTLQLEPHPVSGELELFGDDTDSEAGKVWYRRQDEETLHARCDAKNYGLGLVWVWCSNDAGGVGLEALQGGSPGEASDGWKVAEVLPLDQVQDPAHEGWAGSIAEAQVCGPNATAVNGKENAHLDPVPETSLSADEDDDYWNAYDRTPGPQTPQNKVSQQHHPTSQRVSSDGEYFARYSNEVQPAMDAHDPDEEPEDSSQFESSLRGEQSSFPELQPLRDRDSASSKVGQVDGFPSHNRNRSETIRPSKPVETTNDLHHHQVPQSPAESVAALQRQASNFSAAETSIKQHISYEVKSLFRLAQSVGIERDEFDRVVRTELDVLGLIEL